MFSSRDIKLLYEYFTLGTPSSENFNDNDLKQIYNALAHPGEHQKEMFSDGDYEKIYNAIVEYS